MSILLEKKEKAKVILQKKAIFGEKANVALAIDISGSMGGRYANGTVQELVDRLLGVGMNMDLDLSIDIFAFGRGDYEISQATEQNHRNYVNDVLLRKVRLEGDTKYAGVMKRIADKYSVAQKRSFFGKAKETEVASVPTLVFFVTDGNNSDRSDAERIIRDTSNQAIFWQFVGIGGERFDFLQKLDDMDGRFLDNADFFKVNDLRSISDEELYDRILNEFPTWLKQARQAGILL